MIDAITLLIALVVGALWVASDNDDDDEDDGSGGIPQAAGA